MARAPGVIRARAPRGFACAALCLLTWTGCGGGSGGPAAEGPLAWSEPPAISVPADLPRDRVASGSVRNAGEEVVTLRADELTVRAAGHELRTDVAFLAGFSRGFVETPRGYGNPDDVPEAEQIRIGRLLKLDPGETSAISIAWRLPHGAESLRPVEAVYPDGALELPAIAPADGE